MEHNVFILPRETGFQPDYHGNQMTSIVDAVVVGAGIIGSSIAWSLAESGLRVTLLDAGRFGGEASWAGAGMLPVTGDPSAPSSSAGFAAESARLYPDFVARLEQASGYSIDYRRTGAVEIACTFQEWHELLERSRSLPSGVRCERLDRAQLRKLVPMLEKETAGAVFFPEDAVVDPRDVLAALSRCCRMRNVHIVEGERALVIRTTRESAEVITVSGSIQARAAVLAAGAWSSQIAVFVDEVRWRIPASYPVRGHLIGFPSTPGSLGCVLRHGPTYLLQRKTGYIVAGSSSEDVGFERTIDPGVAADIARRAGELLPLPASSSHPEAWTGFRPATEGFEPALGRVDDSGLWLAYGHYRDGILLAPATARRISAEVSASLGTGMTSDAGSPG